MTLLKRTRFLALLLTLATLAATAQSLTQLGLRSVAGQGRFRGLQADSAGNLYTLLDAQDGLRLVKMDADATTVLAEAHLGQHGDQALALALDPAGNVYVTGTAQSTGALTGTPGTSFPNRADTSINSFLAKFTPTLTEQWLTFLGSGRMAATAVAASADQVVVTGVIYGSTLPVTPNGIQQAPLPNSTGNGFVESFTPASGTLQYGTYLSGANGDTEPAGIALDRSDNAYIVGYTSASGFPTTNALVTLLQTDDLSPDSGFLTKLTPAGDGFVFSTFVPGNGLTSVAVDSANGSLLISGNIAAGLFPVTQVQAPVAANVKYQAALRMPLDGSAVTSSTLLAPGTTSVITGSGSSFAAGVSSEMANVPPLLPVTAAESEGSAFLLVADANGLVQRTARVGGVAFTNAGSASVPSYAGGALLLADGSALLAGGIAPTLSGGTQATQRFDVTLAGSTTTALSGTVRDALPSSTCTDGTCAGGAASLARMAANGSAALALSVDDLPTITVRNPSGATANNLTVTANSFAVQSGCADSLAAGAECDAFLTGAGPGSVTVSASNASSQTMGLPASTRAADVISVTPKQMDFGIVAASAPRSRTLTVQNLSSVTQTFKSQAGLTNSAYTVTQSATTCAPVGDGVSSTLPAGASCTITLQVAASSDSSKDCAVLATWTVGPRNLTLTGYTQASALSMSTTHLGFGRVYQSGLTSARYLYVSNGSDTPQVHTTVVLPPGSPFRLTDSCPTTLAAQSVCRVSVTYASATVPSSDATTISVDGTSVRIDGATVPPPTVTGASSNPNLSVTPTSVTFSQNVVATTVSSETQSVTISNTGAGAFSLNINVTGDFSASTCPNVLGGGTTCVVTLHFTPSQAGTRQGLMSVSAGSSSPVYVTLSGQATAFLPGTGLVNFGAVPLQTPEVQWIKVGQSFPTLTATSSSADYTVLLVEDQGYGYGSPDRSRFQQTASGSCLNCYLGIQFTPSQLGSVVASLAITSTSGGATQTLSLSGTGVGATGLLLTPPTQDFGSAAVNSSTAATFFTLTNASTGAISTAAATFTGDFGGSAATTGGTACGGSLQAGESCVAAVQFAPSAAGPRTGTLSIATSAGTATAALAGLATADPGLALQPNALVFRNVPGIEARQQTISVLNTGSAAATFSTPTSSDSHFTAQSDCSTVAPAAQCSITVTYTPTASLASGQLTFSLTTAAAGSSPSNYTLQLSGLYTSENAGLQIIPGEESTIQFGALAAGSVSTGRIFRVNNLSGKGLTLALQAPRQFPITATTCAGLAAGGSCTVTMAFAPVLNADANGTLFVQGTPTDGTATLNGIAYMEGYGLGTGTVSASGNLSPTGVLDFGQVASGQSTSQSLTLRNQGSFAITLRQIHADFPFGVTSNCGLLLQPNATCTATVTYTPNAQTTVGGNAGSQDNTGVLTLASDAGNSPLLVNLAGRTVPSQTGSPSAAVPVAALTTSQGAITFGSGQVGSASATQAIAVTNTGTVALHIAGVVTSPDFTATTDCGTLPVGSACQVAVSFTPAQAGIRSGSVQIQSDAANGLEYVSLLGTAAPASVTLTPTSLSFGQVLVARSSAAQTATLTNTGSSTVTVGTLGISGDFSLAASANGTACATGLSLAPGASCVLPVVFTPAQTGTRNGTLTVTSSATSIPLSVTLSGVGVQPQLAVSPTSLNFGDVQIGKSQTLALTLANVSATATNALTIGISAGDFSVAATCGPVTLAAGSSCSLNVTFTPTLAGARSGTLTISSSDPASPLTVPLTGNGLQGGSFTLTVNGASSGTATVPLGIPATYALAITPINGFTGSVALTCTSQAIVLYTTCSIAPSTVTLLNGTVNATVTITTVTAVPTAMERKPFEPWRRSALCALPVLLLVGVKRRRWQGGLLAFLFTVGVLASSGCGSGVGGDKRIRYAAPGTYQFTVVASSTTGVTAQQSVPLSLTITNSR